MKNQAVALKKNDSIFGNLLSDERKNRIVLQKRQYNCTLDPYFFKSYREGVLLCAQKPRGQRRCAGPSGGFKANAQNRRFGTQHNMNYVLWRRTGVVAAGFWRPSCCEGHRKRFARYVRPRNIRFLCLFSAGRLKQEVFG